MRKALLIVLVTLFLTVSAVIIAALFLERDSWRICRRLSADLKRARVVRLVEYVPGQVLARKTATPGEIARLQSAANIWRRPFRPDVTACFEPHHRLEIVRADGSDVIVEICFLCGKFALLSDDEPVVALPPSLDKSFTSFFTSVGMKPKTQEEYLHIELSEQNKQTEEAKKQLPKVATGSGPARDR